jgi:hypothetical protein
LPEIKEVKRVTELERAKEILKKRDKQKKRKQKLILIGLMSVTAIIIFVILSFFLNKLKEKTEFSAIKTGREATKSEKILMFTYLVEIDINKISDMEKFELITQNSITSRNNGKIYIGTSLSPYIALEIAEKYKVSGIVAPEGIKILTPMLKLEGDKN